MYVYMYKMSNSMFILRQAKPKSTFFKIIEFHLSLKVLRKN